MKVFLFITKTFMWCCFGMAALIFFPFTIATRRVR